MGNPFDALAIIDRTVTLTPDTKVIALTPQDPKALQAALVKLAQATSTAANPSSLYIQTAVAASSIRVGAQVTVIAAQNIKTLSAFTASEVQIQPTMTLQ